MAHAKVHAESAQRRWGGTFKDYMEIEQWLDEPKYWIGNSSHRMFRHHSEGIKEAEERFGESITNSDGKRVFVKYICEEHIKEDCDGYIPSAKEWLTHLKSGTRPTWMRKTLLIETKGNIHEKRSNQRSNESKESKD